MVEGTDGGDEFLTRGGTQLLVLAVGKDGGIGREVVNIDAHLRAVEDGVFHQRLQTLDDGGRGGVVGDGGKGWRDGALV